MLPTDNSILAYNGNSCQEEVICNPMDAPLGVKLFPVDNGSFVKWLEEEMAARKWRPADLARAGGLYTSTLSKILNEDRQPGPDVCLSIAKAFDIPPDIVFRQAGLLPKLPGPEQDPTFQDILDVVKNMTPKERAELLDYALFRFRKRK